MGKLYSLFVKPLRGTMDLQVKVEHPLLLLVAYGTVGLGIAQVLGQW